MINTYKHIWRKAIYISIPCIVLFVGGITLNSIFGGLRKGNIEHKLIALIGVILFTIFAITFLHIITDAIKKDIIAHRLGIGRAASLQFILRVFGYLAILIIAIDRVGIPVGRLLLGSAVLGIILGVAAQQALANFFASIVLIIAHPFSVGQEITLVSGGLGGTYNGEVTDISLTHTHLREKNGTIIALPNSTLLTGAAIKVDPKFDKNYEQN